jgi:hypothetical protein
MRNAAAIKFEQMNDFVCTIEVFPRFLPAVKQIYSGAQLANLALAMTEARFAF